MFGRCGSVPAARIRSTISIGPKPYLPSWTVMITDEEASSEPLRPPLASAAWKRVAYGAVAVVMTLIGLLGVLLPGLPTTPFILVALWAAARSNDRLAAWLRRIRILRAAIAVSEDYARHRSLPMRLKILSQVMAYSAILLVWLVTRSTWVTVVVACAAVASTITMVLTPTAESKAAVRRRQGGDRGDGDA